MPKELDRTDEMISVDSCVLPFRAAIGVEGVEFDPVEPSVADLPQGQTRLDEVLAGGFEHLLERVQAHLVGVGLRLLGCLPTGQSAMRQTRLSALQRSQFTVSLNIPGQAGCFGGRGWNASLPG